MQRITAIFTIGLFIGFAFEGFAQRAPEGPALRDSATRNLLTQQPKKPALAITTFENLSAFPENAWVGAGFAESLTTKLSKLETVEIMERRQLNLVLKEGGLEQKGVSEAHWEKAEAVGKTLYNLRGVEYLLIGSVQMTGKYDDPDAELFVNARTVKVETAEVTKGEATGLKGKAAELFALQTRLAEWFVQTLGIQPNAVEKKGLAEKETESLASYRLYILGQGYLDEGKFSEAKAAFWAAAQPANFPAALLAWAEASKREIMERERTGARDEARRSAFTASAREIASQGAVGIYVLGLESEFNGKYDEALKHYRTFLDYTQNKVVRWKVDGMSFMWYPVIWQGKVYVSANNAIHAFDAKTGTRLWSSTQFPVRPSPPAVSEGTVFFSLGRGGEVEEKHGVLYALDAQTGAIRWQFEQADAFGDAPKVAGDIVFVASVPLPRTAEDNATLCAVDGHNGQLLWKTAIGWFNFSWEASLFAVLDGVVYLRQIFFRFDETTQQGFIKSAALLALDAKNGQMLWQFDFPPSKEGAKQPLPGVEDDSEIGFPSVSEEVVAVAWLDEGLYGLERKTGKLLWKRKGYLPWYGPPILASGLIYVDSEAYDAKTGELRWKTDVGRVVAAADGIVFAEGGRRLCALESQTGALRWQYDAQDEVRHTYAPRYTFVAEGTVYLLTGNLLLHALSLKSGELLWKFNLTHPESETAFLEAQDGIVYFSRGRTFYALTGGEGGRATPSDLDAQIAIGRTLRLKGELNEAQTTLQKVVDAKPNLPEAYVEMAEVSESLGDVHQAVKSWNKVSQYVSPLDARYQRAIERLKEGAGLLWRYETQEPRLYGNQLFFIREGILYVRNNSRPFYALDAQRGKLLWKVYMGGGVHISMEEDAVYYDEMHNELQAFALQNGKPIWKSEAPGVYTYPLAVSEGVVLTGGIESLAAFSAKDGTLLWNMPLDGSPLITLNAILIEQGLVYLVQRADENKTSPRRLRMSTLELQTGKPLWRYETESLAPSFSFFLPSSPLFAHDGLIYLLTHIPGVDYDSQRSFLYALDGKTGKLVWKYEKKGGLLDSPLIVPDGVLYGAHALNAKTGERIWAAPVDYFQPVQISEGILYGYGSYKGPDFSALSAKSGELLWRFQLSPEGRFFSHALSDGILYLGYSDHLYALDAKTGSLIWSYETGAGVMAICVSEGVLYTLTRDGAISAFDLEKAAALLKLPHR